jgi:GNAT superfamily N-acetyltransferase
MTSTVRIREATELDSISLTELLDQLGYPSSADEIRLRLRELAASPQAQAWVAADAGVVAGLATCHMFPSVHASAPVAWLTTLVVNESHRGQGMGRELVATAEAWASARGAVRLSLTSGTQRVAAHAFYARIGYEQSGVRLTKTLGPARGEQPDG